MTILTRAAVGLSLTTQLQTLLTNPANSGENRTIEVRFANITANAASSDVTQCLMIDASASNAQRPMMATNTTVRARETISTRIVLEPGDAIQVSGSGSSAIYASAQQVFAEPNS